MILLFIDRVSNKQPCKSIGVTKPGMEEKIPQIIKKQYGHLTLRFFSVDDENKNYTTRTKTTFLTRAMTIGGYSWFGGIKIATAFRMPEN